MIAAALSAHALASSRVWQQDRTLTVGASEVGQCARRIYFAKNEGDPVYGKTRDAGFLDSWGAKARGSIYEDAWWYPALKAAYGDRLLLAGPEQRTFVDGFLSATTDALLVDLPSDALAHLGVGDLLGSALVIDCKTIDPRARLDGPKAEHVFQVQVQIGLIRKLTPYRPSFGLLTYTDASFWDDVREFPVAFDPAAFSVAEIRAREIMLARGIDDVRPEGVVAGGSECRLCPFTTACGQARADRVPKETAPIPSLLASAIAAKALKAKALKDKADELTESARALEQEVRDDLAEAGTRRLDHEGLRVLWSPVKGRPSWDHKGIREAASAAGLDLSPFERTGDPTDRLAITEIPVASAPGPIAA